MKRNAAAAGQFYPAQKEELQSVIAELSPQVEEPEEVFGALSPHAGYVFSGATAASVFSNIKIPETVILLTPSHNFASPPVALWTGGPWETPLGVVKINEEMTDSLRECSVISAEDKPHRPEHSGEVILPFLQYHRSDLKIVPICITQSAKEEDVMELGKELKVIMEKNGEEDTLVVASSDMSHEQGPDALDTVQNHDPLAIEKMKDLNPEGLIQTCRENNITMCGVLPAAAMMESVRQRGGTEGKLVKQASSADSPYGRGNYVVGYAGMYFK